MQAAGFEPAKRYAEDLEPSPFDHSGTPAPYRKKTWILLSRMVCLVKLQGIVDVSPLWDAG